MISQPETKLAAAAGVNGLAFYWDHYINPVLQGLLLVVTLIGAIVLVANRIQDWKLKRYQLKDARDAHRG